MDMRKKHMAIYGSVKIPRMYCGKCKQMSLVVDNILQCCDKVINNKLQKRPEVIVNECGRSYPSIREKRRIEEVQGNKCLYCNKSFGTMYTRKGKTYIKYTQKHYDHLIPYSYSKANKGEFVGACNICNGIKSNKMFNTVEEVFHYVEYHRKKKGYIYADEELPILPQKVSL